MPPRCARRSWRSSRARSTWASAVGVEKLAGAGLLGAGGRPKSDKNEWTPERSLRRRHHHRRPHRHRQHARRVRPGGHGVRPQVRRHQLRAVRQDQREEPRAQHAQPAGRLHQADDARRDHERRHDRLPEHAPDVLRQLRRRRGRRGGQRRQAEDAVARAATAGHQGLGLGAHQRSVRRRAARCCPTSTRSPATRRSIAYEQAGIGPEDLDLVELHDCFATAELVHYDNLMLCPRGRRGRLLQLRCTMARRVDAGQRVGRPASPRATRSPRPASPTSGRSAITCVARPAIARSRAPRSASPTSSVSARPAACTSSRRRRSASTSVRRPPRPSRSVSRLTRVRRTLVQASWARRTSTESAGIWHT